MDRNVVVSALLVPLLLVAGTGTGSGANCNYTKPELVFKKACIDDACRANVKRYLPECKAKYRSDLIKKIKHQGGTEKAPHLSMAVIQKLTECMSKADFGRFDSNSLDFSRFSDVSHDVRAEKFEKVASSCSGKNCAQAFIRPVVGQTTFVYGPA